MTYLPTDLINSNYTYYSDGESIIVFNGSSCFSVFPKLDYLVSNSYVCESVSLPTIPFETFTDTLSYRYDFDKILIMLFIILFGMIFLLSCLCKNFFRGVFKS